MVSPGTWRTGSRTWSMAGARDGLATGLCSSVQALCTAHRHAAEGHVGAETQPEALLAECLVWCGAGFQSFRRGVFFGFAQSRVWAGCDQGWLLPPRKKVGSGRESARLEAWPRLSSLGPTQVRVGWSHFSWTHGEPRRCQPPSWPAWDSRPHPSSIGAASSPRGEQEAL